MSDRAVSELMAEWRVSPVQFVQDVFKAEPDEWQLDVLRALPTSPRTAMSACKGPGKSCLLAWAMWWFLCVHVDAQIIAVSITADNLKDNLWKELAIWQSRSRMLLEMFELNAERIVSKLRERTWWCSARSFPKMADVSQQSNTLAGFHGEDIMIVLDEVGDYPHGVLSAAEAIFANPVNAHLVVAGNPTSTKGPLYSITTRDAAQWHITYITGDPDDPKRSPRISEEWARGEISKWGRENPWVMVNILGLFPPAGSKQLISANDVTLAMQRDVPGLAYLDEAIIWGLDPARSLSSGADEAALARRQGILSRPFKVWRGLDGTDLGDAIGQLLLEAEDEGEFPDAVFVDVGGVGASCFDRLTHLGWDDTVLAVDFGSSPSDARYLNKRAEIWWLMNEWLKKMPSCLPQDPVLQSELPSPEFEFRVANKQTKFVLESKEHMEKRGVSSPNRGDALALTFSAPVAPIHRGERIKREAGRQDVCVTEYDPLG